jgi:20S proteasome alpha/beta subunit
MPMIKESYHASMSLRDAEKLVLQVLKNVMEEKIGRDNVELIVIRSDTRLLETKSSVYVEEMVATLS